MKEQFPFFSKENTLIIKGFAIILMLVHHLWAFKSIDDFNGIWNNYASLLIMVGKSGKICVGMFTFLSGYGLYYSCCNKNIICYVIDRLKKLLVSFWKYALPLLLILLMTGQFVFSLSDFFHNIFMLKSNLNGAWWYLQFYAIMLLLFPYLYSFFQKEKHSLFYILFASLSTSLTSLLFIR